MKTVNCEGIEYPAHQAEGNAARWIMPMAKHYCVGAGIDVGYSNENWRMPGAYGVDFGVNEYHAMNIPFYSEVSQNAPKLWDFLFSSHCLEHVKENWHNVLDYWLTKIRVGGILFLYLPHASQRYWQPRNNRKHIHSFTGDEIAEYLRSLGHQVFLSGVDLNHSFCVVCEKVEKEPEFGSDEYYRQKEKVIADEKELYCKERNIAYIRDGNNVIYNEPSHITGFYKDNEIEINIRASRQGGSQ